MLRELARKIDRFQDVLGRALSWLMLAMVLTVFFDVVSRYLFARTYVFTQELEWYIFAVAYLMAGGYVMLWDEHVRVDIMYSRMSPRKRAWVDFILLFVFFFPSALLVIYTTWPFFRNAWTVYEGSPDPGGIPARWALKGVIIVAFSIMVIQGVSEAIKRFYWAMGWEQPQVRARELR
jgi:TRAP-type mannitol/chloroaromatic compound transport system permease small subunit